LINVIGSNNVAIHTKKQFFNMPSHSIKSSSTFKTLRTVDDVFTHLEELQDRDTGLNDSFNKIMRLTAHDKNLAKDAIDSLYDPVEILKPVSVNPEALLRSMFVHRVLLSGIQATSFFYPLCEFVDAPWDFFCCNRYDSESFVREIAQSCGIDLVEEITADNGIRVVYFRRNMNGESKPINIRIYISDDEPLHSVLSQSASYQQSFVSAVGAVCFWPRLNKKRLYRRFDLNASRLVFPSGRTALTINMQKMSRTTPKNPSSTPSIYTVVDKRTEMITFKNKCGADSTPFKKETKRLENIVYAISEKSTKYLGDMGDM
jgi:hypothetical protein